MAEFGACNVGTLDRGLRIGVGVVLLSAPFIPGLAGVLEGLGAWRYAVSAAGVIAIATGVMRFCPAYVLLGIRTCPADQV